MKADLLYYSVSGTGGHLLDDAFDILNTEVRIWILLIFVGIKIKQFNIIIYKFGM